MHNDIPLLQMKLDSLLTVSTPGLAGAAYCLPTVLLGLHPFTESLPYEILRNH
jgi:hypothetical protein